MKFHFDFKHSCNMSIFRFKFLFMEICLQKKSREKSYDIKKSLCVIFGSCSLTYEYLLVNSATYTTSLGNDHTTENESL